ncbi:MAG: FecR domain-containing protein [Mediterranea sp.]|jgi:ferric-dicitrate binding protein FerR (iron transport regulator)|nr:FecR domain-containing protein [Mediterranea sp.]
MTDLNDKTTYRFLTGKCSQTELDEVNAYIQESEENAERLFRMEEVYHLGQFDRYADARRVEQAEKRLRKRIAAEQAIQSRQMRRQHWMRYAAILVIATLIGGTSTYLFLRYQSETQQLTATATNGQVLQVILPDSSKVWLNAGSSLTYPTTFSKEERNVFLTGEAYFEVSKNPRCPFIVKSNALQVRVLGTKFNIKNDAHSHIAETTLIEGAVEVRGNRSEGQIVLAPGQRAELDKESHLLTVKQVNARLDAVWHNDLIPFDKATIFTIAKALEQLYNVKIIISPDITGQMTYSGMLKRKSDITSTLNLLRNTMHVQFKQIGKDSIFISPSKD